MTKIIVSFDENNCMKVKMIYPNPNPSDDIFYPSFSEVLSTPEVKKFRKCMIMLGYTRTDSDGNPCTFGKLVRKGCRRTDLGYDSNTWEIEYGGTEPYRYDLVTDKIKEVIVEILKRSVPNIEIIGEEFDTQNKSYLGRPDWMSDGKWNGKIYGYRSKKSIYVDGEKIELSDNQLKELNDYLKEMKEYERIIYTEYNEYMNEYMGWMSLDEINKMIEEETYVQSYFNY